MNLVSDRTEKDYLAAKELSKIPWRQMNDGQKAQWLGFMKGRYTYDDLNRVESAVLNISSRMIALPVELDEYAADGGTEWDRALLPYDPNAVDLTTKTDWTPRDMFPSEERHRYLNNVKFIRDVFVPDMPLPLSMEGIKWMDANDIETALMAADIALTELRERIIESIDIEVLTFKLHSGEIYSGEV